MLDVVTILSDFADFRAVASGATTVTIEFGRSGREHRRAHVAQVVQAVSAVDIELLADDTADEVRDRDAAGDPERVLFERGDAALQVRDGGVLGGVRSFQGRDAVANGDLVAADEEDELADVRDVRAVALDGAVHGREIDRGAAGGRGATLEAGHVSLEELKGAVEGSDVVGVLATERVGLVGQAVRGVGARGSGVGLGLRRVEGDTLRGDLVLQIAEDRRIDATVVSGEGRFQVVDTSGVGGHVVGEASDGALGGGQPHALGSDVGGKLLHGVAQRVDVSLGER